MELEMEFPIFFFTKGVVVIYSLQLVVQEKRNGKLYFSMELVFDNSLSSVLRFDLISLFL